MTTRSHWRHVFSRRRKGLSFSPSRSQRKTRGLTKPSKQTLNAFDQFCEQRFLQTLQLDVPLNIDLLRLLIAYIAPGSSMILLPNSAAKGSVKHTITRPLRSLGFFLRQHFGTQVASDVGADFAPHQPQRLSDDLYSQLQHTLCPLPEEISPGASITSTPVKGSPLTSSVSTIPRIDTQRSVSAVAQSSSRAMDDSLLDNSSNSIEYQRGQMINPSSSPRPIDDNSASQPSEESRPFTPPFGDSQLDTHPASMISPNRSFISLKHSSFLKPSATYPMENGSVPISQYSQRLASFVSIMETVIRSSSAASIHTTASPSQSRAIPISTTFGRPLVFPNFSKSQRRSGTLSFIQPSDITSNTSSVLSPSLPQGESSSQQNQLASTNNITQDSLQVHKQLYQDRVWETSLNVQSDPFPCDICCKMLMPPSPDTFPRLSKFIDTNLFTQTTPTNTQHSHNSVSALQLIQLSILFHEQNDLYASCHLLQHAVHQSQRIKSNPTALFLLALHLRHGWGCHLDISTSYRLLWTATATVLDLYCNEVEHVTMMRQSKRRKSTDNQSVNSRQSPQDPNLEAEASPVPLNDTVQLDADIIDSEADIEDWSIGRMQKQATIKHHVILQQMPPRIAEVIRKCRHPNSLPLKLPSFLQDAWATSTASSGTCLSGAPDKSIPTSLTLSLLRSTLGILIYEIAQSIRFGWIDSTEVWKQDESASHHGKKKRMSTSASSNKATTPPILSPVDMKSSVTSSYSTVLSADQTTQKDPSKGQHTLPNPHLAHRLLLIAAHLGDPSACVDLGQYLIQRSGKANKRSAVPYFRVAAVVAGWYEYGMGWVFKEKYDPYCQ